MLETADIGSDIDIDLIFASHYGQFMGILYNNGNGQFSSPEYYNLDYHPSGLACGDLNGDDREDILVSGGAYIDVWYNYSTSLQYCNISDTAYVSRIEIADIDNDEDNDIIATRWGMPGVPKRLFIYSNDGANNFYLSYSKWIYEAMSNIFISDLNNDNFPDVIYNVSYSYPNSDYELFHTYILFNNQDGTFQDPVNYYTGICSHKSYSADLDGNGWNDIITLNYDFYNPPPDTGSIHILFNDGTGNFVEDPQVGVDEENEIFYNISNYPNPFHNTTRISFSVRGQYVRAPEVIIYNLKGQLVKELENITKINSCNYSVQWDGKNNKGREMANGVYFYKLTADNNEIVKKMILMR